MKIGFIGTGWFTKMHASILGKMDGIEVTAFCGTSLEKAENEARNWPSATGYTKVEEMLDKQKLDAVYICVPPMSHGAIEHALIERDIPFFVEKPLGLGDEPTEIAKKIEETSLITSVGYHWRYTQTARRAIELLKDRKAGMALGYWMGTMPMVPWWREESKSGGQFHEQTTHIVDLLRFCCGEVNEVYAAFNNQIMPEKVEGTTVPDVGTVTMKLTNGMVATISNTCILKDSYKTGLDLYTDDGVIEIHSDKLRKVNGKQVEEFKATLNPYIAETKAFLHAVKTGDTTGILSDYGDALKTHKITTAANQSAITGKPIKIPI